jgi:hypothetical protein
VFVGGTRVVADGVHAEREAIARRYQMTLGDLLVD